MAGRDFWLFLAAAGLSSVLTFLIRRWAISHHIAVNEPRERDIHKTAIPRLGGLAVVAAFFMIVITLVVVSPSTLGFVPERWLSIDRNLMGLMIGAFVLLLVGIYDDVLGLSPWKKLTSHFVAGVILAASGVLIFHISNPFGNHIQLGDWAGWLVVFWVVVMINAMNWIDGLDGLASGVSLIAALILYFLAIEPTVNQISMSVLAIILAGALAGFLPFNFYPAKIFLGDSGSQVLGFLLAAFAIISGGKLATAFLILGVPLIDTVWVIARRLVSRQAIYQADRLHIHHRLLAAGLSQRQAVASLYVIAALFGTIALNTRTLGKFMAGLLLLVMMAIGGAVLVWITKLKNVNVKK